MKKAIDYLKEIRRLDVSINEDIEELERLNALATKTTTVLGDERVQSSGSKSRLEDWAIKIACMKDDINKDIDRLLDMKKEIHELIRKSCDAECMTILFKRYFEYKKWEQIALEMGFTYQYVSGKLHRRALKQFEKNLKKD